MKKGIAIFEPTPRTAFEVAMQEALERELLRRMRQELTALGLPPGAPIPTALQLERVACEVSNEIFADADHWLWRTHRPN